MWALIPLQAGGQTHYLHSGKEYVVGRKNCDILLSSDQSISRAHAQLAPSNQGMTLKDTSKYGTFVNSQRLTGSTAVNLTPGDSVTFGVFESKFSVERLKPLVCSSCLDADGKALLSQSLAALGGELVNSWSRECTHLAMTSVKVTVKTISALLCCVPIVKPEFFSELSRCVQQKLPPPNNERFIPEIDEPSLLKEEINIGVIPGRKTIFTGKTFLFLSAKQVEPKHYYRKVELFRQVAPSWLDVLQHPVTQESAAQSSELKRLGAAVGFGGGRSLLLEEGSLPRQLLECPQSCVIDVASGSSQPPVPSSTTEWAKAVKNLVQRKGLRVIPESEIGLAAIYASCDRHCNPSHRTADSGSAPKVNPRIASASLSQSLEVDETALPAASQNVTAYAVNTQTSQGTQQSKVCGGMVVGETPEKRQNQSTSRPHVAIAEVQKPATRQVMDSARAFTDGQRKRPEARLAAGPGSTSTFQPSLPATNGGPKRFPSPQKPKAPAQVSPQKQSTLTSFFQPVNKKRPLLDEPSVSDPKRAALESPVAVPSLNVSDPQKAPLGSAAHLRPGQSEGRRDSFSLSAQAELNNRKRKEMEEDMEMEELESIMSLDMDVFDELPAVESQHAQTSTRSSREERGIVATAEASSASKRPRLYFEDGPDRRQRCDARRENHSEKPERPAVSVRTEEPLSLSERSSTRGESSKRPQMSSSATHSDVKACEDAEDLQRLTADTFQPKEETRIPVKAVPIKQEVQQAAFDGHLPNKLLVVEFRSLTVAQGPKVKAQGMPDASRKKNFKCFRKHSVPGTRGSPDIIAGSGLLVHNRGKNSELDEWLKDAVEEERQSRQDENVGDDLFRYNPTKPSRRR